MKNIREFVKFINFSRNSTSVVQTLIRAQMPSKVSVISNLEGSFNTVPAAFKPRDRLPKNKDFVTKISLAKILKDAVRFLRNFFADFLGWPRYDPNDNSCGFQ